MIVFLFGCLLLLVIVFVVVRTLLSNPWVLLLAAGVFCYFYYVIPAHDPTAPRFGELNPGRNPASWRSEPAKDARPAIPILVCKALPLTATVAADRRKVGIPAADERR